MVSIDVLPSAAGSRFAISLRVVPPILVPALWPSPADVVLKGVESRLPADSSEYGVQMLPSNFHFLACCPFLISDWQLKAEISADELLHIAV